MVVEPFFELDDDILNGIDKRRQRLSNPKPLKRSPFPSGYIEDELQINVQLGIRSDDARVKTRYYLVVFEYFPFMLLGLH